MKLTCVRAEEIYNFLKFSTANEFLQDWSSIFDELLNGISGKEISAAASAAPKIDEVASLPLHTKAACLVLIEFLRVSAQFPNVSKELSTKHLHTLFQRLTSKQFVYNDCLLLTLKSCLQFYPSSCGHFFGKALLRHLQQFSDLSSSILRHNAADCYSLLPFLGPAGEKNCKHAENWQDQVEFFLVAIHDCLKLLLGSNVDTLNCQFRLISIKLTQFPEKLSSLDIEKLANRIDFCGKSLKFMFFSNFPQPFYVKIPISHFLDLLQCSINAINLHKSLRNHVIQILIDNISSIIQIFSILPEILGHILAPYCPKIFDFLESALFSIKNLQNSVKIFELKSSIYQFLGEIGLFLSVSSRINVVLPKFWSYMKRDLEILTKNDDLAQSSGLKTDSFRQKNKPGKGKKVKTNNDIQQQIDFGDQFIQKRKEMTPKQDIIVHIGRSLSNIIAQCGSAFKAALYRDLQQFICKLLLSIRINLSPNGSHDILGPYQDVTCRLALLEVLRSLVLCRHPDCAPAIQCAMQIFTGFSTNEPKEIIDFCHQALLALNCATKPRVPSLESCIGVNETLRKSGDFEQHSEIEEESENFIIRNTGTTNFNDFSNFQENQEASLFTQMNENEPILAVDHSNAESPCDETIDVDKQSVDTDDMDTVIVNIGSESSSDEECEEICILPPSKRAKISTETEQRKSHVTSPEKTNQPKDHVTSPEKTNQPKNHVTSPEKTNQPKNHVTSPEKTKQPKDHVIVPEKTNEEIVHMTKEILHVTDKSDKTIEVMTIEDLLEDFVDAPAD